VFCLRYRDDGDFVRRALRDLSEVIVSNRLRLNGEDRGNRTASAGFMKRDFFDPTTDELQLIAVSRETTESALQMISSCEHCQPEDGQIPFDWILDRVTGRSGAATDYILTEQARCPTCKHEITEKTLLATIGQ